MKIFKSDFKDQLKNMLKIRILKGFNSSSNTDSESDDHNLVKIYKELRSESMPLIEEMPEE